MTDVIPNGRYEHPDSLLRHRLAAFERGVFMETFRRFRGDRVQTAAYLGVTMRTLHYKMVRHNLKAWRRAIATGQEEPT
jgi:DNA-binding NtrC family response regulator